MKFNLQFRNKIIFTNVLITIVALGFVCYFVVQGILYYSINDSISKLNNTSEEINLLINQSLSNATKEDIIKPSLDVDNVMYFGDLISKNYSMKVIIYDNEGLILWDNFNTTLENPFYVDIQQTLVRANRNYVYTQVNNTNYIFFSSPIVNNNSVVGAFTLAYSTYQIDQIINWTMKFFIGTIAVATILIFIVCLYSYSRILKPITQLEQASLKIASGNYDNEYIEYEKNDELGSLIKSYNQMSIEVKQTIATLSMERETLANILASLDDGVIAVSVDKNNITTNKKAIEYFGVNISDNMFEDIPPLVEIYNRVKENKVSLIKEFSYLDRHFLANANYISHSQESSLILMITRDVTDLKNIEKEERKFISSISHELRTPLTTILGYVDLLQRRGTENKEVTEKALEYTKKEGLRLLRLVTDLLNITKYGSVDFEFVFDVINPSVLIEETIHDIATKIEENNISISYDKVDLPSIQGDYDRLKQVLTNILDNAVKYSKDGDNILVIASFDENDVEISVRDFGEGIPDAAKEKVFNAFYRVEEDRSRETGGTGLGLSIVKHIVEKHNGSIAIESKLGQGTRVIIKLPILREDKINEENV